MVNIEGNRGASLSTQKFPAVSVRMRRVKQHGIIIVVQKKAPGNPPGAS